MHWRQRRTGGPVVDRDPEERIRDRHGRRSAEVASTVALLLTTSAAEVSHERVSEETGLPVGYLRWAYPTRADLLTGADARLPAILTPHPRAVSADH